MSAASSDSGSVGRDSVVRSVQGVLRTHTVDPAAVGETVAVLGRAIGGLIAVEFEGEAERDAEIERAVMNIREGIAHGLTAQE